MPCVFTWPGFDRDLPVNADVGSLPTLLELDAAFLQQVTGRVQRCVVNVG